MTKIEDLLDSIRSRQEPIPKSLDRCGIDPTARKDNSLDEVLGLARENINVFPLSAVKPCWFQLYANTCVAKAAELLRELDTAHNLEDAQNGQILFQIVSVLDNGLIIAGGGNEETRATIHEVLRRLDEILYPRKDIDSNEKTDDEDFQPPPTKKRRLVDGTTRDFTASSQIFPTTLAFIPRIAHPIPCLDNPSLARFESTIRESNTPIKLINTLTHWPALRKWHDAEYWRRRTLTGLRLVPIEIGQSYTDEGWRQEIMTVGRFLEDFILKGDDADEVGYLAQHELFSQIPDLLADIGVPDYCFADVPVSPGDSRGSDRNVGRDDLSEPTKHTSGDVLTSPSDCSGSKRKSDTTDFAGTIDGRSSCDYVPAKRVRGDQGPMSSHVTVNEEMGINDEAKDDPALSYQNHETRTFTTQTTLMPQTDTSPTSSQSSSLPPPPLIHQNIWFGTRTVTPLHHDPYSNILTQIHGTKYVRLYSPTYTQYLYPRSSKELAPHVPSGEPTQSHEQSDEDERNHSPSTIDMSNTSNIPLWAIEQSPHEDWDELYPGFGQVPYLECLLQEGDALYIPKGWWHYVRGVSAVGIGVSFWW